MHFFNTKRVLIPLFLIAVLFALVLPSFGQERFGTVSGVVKDPSGAVLPSVTVTVTNKDTNRTVSIHTRGDGSYTLPDIEPGHYSVEFVKAGFTRREVPDVMVLVGKNTSIDVSMHIGTVQESVEVSGTAPVIDVTTTMISHNVTAEEINSLPKGRNYVGVAVFSPSVNTGTIEGGYQINGASGAENSYYVDGVSTNSLIDGSSRQTATFDYIQEVQVKTTGLEAEYGGALGGVVSAITKSGGNTFHGDAHFYYAGNKISSGPTPRMQLSDDMTTFQYFQDSKRKQDNYEIGGSLGGPIVKNKLFFYTNVSPSWLRQSRTLTFTDGVGTFGTKALAMNWFSKLSFEPTSRVRMNFTWLYTPQYLTGVTPGPSGQAPDVSTSNLEAQRTNSFLGFSQPEQSYTGQIDITPTNSSVLSIKAGRYRLNYKDTGVQAQTEWWWQASSLGFPAGLLPPDAYQANGYITPSAGQIVHDLTTRTYAQADFSQFVHFAGQHNFKFGVGTQKNINNVFSTDDGPNGRVYLYWNMTCAVCTPAGATGTYGYYRVDDFARRGSAGANINHIYFQDSWKIAPRLTINAGVRLEKETIPSFRPDIQKYAFQFGYGDKFAPRLGASFDLFGNGKVKISGGWGRYFDWTKLDLARGTFGADLWHVFYRSLDTTDVFSLGLNNMPGTNLWNGAFRDRRLPGFNTVDPKIKPMSQDTMNAGVEWEIQKNLVFTGRYVRSSLNRTIEDMGVLVNGDESYFYGNPGEGQNTESPSCYQNVGGTVVPTCTLPMPKPKRVYDAMELSLSRRFGHGLLFNASYVYSRLWGNYSGLQSTDEITPPTLGYSSAGNQSFYGQTFRPGGNANRYFDLDETIINAHGQVGNYGPLPTDRPHVFKFYGAKQFKFGTEIGGFFRLSSGTPVTTQVQTVNGIGMYVEHRGDMGRTPVFSQTDLMVAHEFKVGKGEAKRLRFEFNALNLFNQKTSVFTMDRYNFEETYDSTGINTTGLDLRNGFDWKAMAAAAALAGGSNLDPRYGKAAMFNTGFQGRLLVKFTF